MCVCVGWVTAAVCRRVQRCGILAAQVWGWAAVVGIYATFSESVWATCGLGLHHTKHRCVNLFDRFYHAYAFFLLFTLKHLNCCLVIWICRRSWLVVVVIWKYDAVLQDILNVTGFNSLVLLINFNQVHSCSLTKFHPGFILGHVERIFMLSGGKITHF